MGRRSDSDHGLVGEVEREVRVREGEWGWRGGEVFAIEERESSLEERDIPPLLFDCPNPDPANAIYQPVTLCSVDRIDLEIESELGRMMIRGFFLF